MVSSSTCRGLDWDWAKLEGEFYAGRWGEGVRWRSWLGLVLGVDSGRDGGYMEAMDLFSLGRYAD